PVVNGPQYNLLQLADADGLVDTRAFTHVLHFTTQLGGQRRGDFFAAANPGAAGGLAPYTDSATYASRWGEVVYFLRDTGTRTPGNPGVTGSSLPIYTLFRQV